MINLFKVFTPHHHMGSQIDEILKSGQLTSGVYVRKFEELLQEYLGNPYVMVTGNNTYATLIALALFNLRNDDEVIASPMACLASNQPVLNFGAKLIWADIDPKTGTLDPDDVKRKISARTKIIIHYHWGGYLGHINEINALGREYGIPVIDDAIESFGSEYRGTKVGNLGSPITTFSFQTVRLPNSIDGGALAFSDETLYRKALLMRDFGITRSTFRDNLGEISSASDIQSVGYNAIMNEISAFVGVEVMKETTKLLDVQRKNSEIWDEYFQNIASVYTLNRSEILPNYWIYSILTNERNVLLDIFRKKGIYASKVHLRNDYYSCFGRIDNNLKGVAEFEGKQLSVPCGWWIDDLKRILNL